MDYETKVKMIASEMAEMLLNTYRLKNELPWEKIADHLLGDVTEPCDKAFVKVLIRLLEDERLEKYGLRTLDSIRSTLLKLECEQAL